MSDDTLRFPSGLTVAQAIRDAEQLKAAEDIPLHEALDRVATHNRVYLSWDEALAQLARERAGQASVEGLFSCDSLTLLALQKEAGAYRKRTGTPYRDALEHACERHGFDDPALAAKALYIKVSPKEIHRVLAGPMVLMLTAYGHEMFLHGGRAAERPLYGYWHYSSVVYGVVTDLAEAKGGEMHLGGARPLNKGWWLSKRSLHEPRIDLSGLSFEQVRVVADLLGFQVSAIGKHEVFFEMGVNFYHSPIFASVAKWARRHPRLATQGRSVYSGDWGAVALGKVPPY